MNKIFEKIKSFFKACLKAVKPIIDKITPFYKKISDIATPTAVLAVICVVVALALSSTNALTKTRIDTLALEKQNEAMVKLMKGEYEASTLTVDDEEINYHVVKKDGKTIGYIFKTIEKGYGGEITVMTAINTDASVAAVEIIDASGETPGLGQNVTKEDFYWQFKGLTHDIVAIKGGSADKAKNEINAVTGATISSKAVTKAVNTAIDYATKIIESSDADVASESNLPKGDELK